MEKIKISVIVPVYNTEKYLEECLQSILGQTVTDIEVICVDDGSTDSSIDMIRSLQLSDKRLKLLTQKNKGGGEARNLGMSKAVGEYLMFLDSDDYFEEELMEKMYQRAEETKAHVCICKAKCYHEDLGFTTPEPAALREEFLPEKEVFSWKDMPDYIFNTFHNWPWNKIFSRKFIEERGIRFQSLKRTNDLLFTNKALMEAERISVVNEELVNYRVGIQGNCQTTNVLTPMDFYYAFEALKAYLVEKGVFEEVKQSYVNHALDGCIANLNSQEGDERQKELYDFLKEGGFKGLSIEEQEEAYFYSFNERAVRSWCTIVEKDYPAFLKQRIFDLKEERDRCLKDDYRDKVNIRIETEHWTAIRVTQEVEQVFYASTTYRVGKAVMAIPQLCKKAISRILKRDHEFNE